MAVDDQVLRKQLSAFLDGGKAHVDYRDAVADMPAERQGENPAALPYTPWQQLEHMRMSQWDILEYIRNPKYVSPPWPSGYWPGPMPPGPDAWQHSVQEFERDRNSLRGLIEDPATSLLAQLPHGKKGHTVLREILLAVDHTAYHLGELIVLRRLLKSWPE